MVNGVPFKSKPNVILAAFDIGLGGAGAQVAIMGEQVELMFIPPPDHPGGSEPARFRFGGDVAKRLAEGLDKAARHLLT